MRLWYCLFVCVSVCVCECVYVCVASKAFERNTTKPRDTRWNFHSLAAVNLLLAQSGLIPSVNFLDSCHQEF